MAHWSRTTLREKLVKVGGRISGYRLVIAVARSFIARRRPTPFTDPPPAQHDHRDQAVR
jgi:hypothetical protein